MANKSLFKSQPKPTGIKLNVPSATAVNAAGGKAHAMEPKHALLQMIMTGTLTNTFYSAGEKQLGDLLVLAQSLAKTDPEFLSKAALFAREKGYMKDSPALLLAVLASEYSEPAREALKKAFLPVMNNGKMLKNFAQMIRSGQFGRKSLGASSIKKLMQKWFANRTSINLFKDSIGTAPSLADVIKMVHPKPSSDEQASLYAYLIDKPLTAEAKEGNYTVTFDKLPALIQEFENWKKNTALPVPAVPFQMLTAQKLTKEQWTDIAKKASWQTIRMNLNTFLRHGVFSDPEVVTFISNRLKDPSEIKRANIFPYQLLTAFKNIENGVPTEIVKALEEAMEISVDNIPALQGNVVICPDVSGSMSSPVTGSNGSATSKARCIDVAALVAAALLRKNPNARVLPFEGAVVPANRLTLDPKASIMENAKRLAAIGGGSTNCAAPLAQLNVEHATVDYVIYISDNESWVTDQSIGRIYGGGRGTSTMVQWELLKKRMPNAKMVCIDVQPNQSTQAVNREDILNIGGFSDSVFELMCNYFIGKKEAHLWTSAVEEITF